MTRMAGQAELPFFPEEVARLKAAFDQVRAQVRAEWDRRAAIPGNTWILPHQGTQHETGNQAELDWQYPFFRDQLVREGLLPAKPPIGAPKELQLPPGMSVLQAIQAGVIR